MYRGLTVNNGRDVMIQKKDKWVNKVLKGYTKLSIFIVVMVVLTCVPAITVYSVISFTEGNYVTSFIGLAFVLILLKVNKEVK